MTTDLTFKNRSLLAIVKNLCYPFRPEQIVAVSIFLFSAGLLIYALYLEQISGLVPCPLCLAQRIMIFIITLSSVGIVFFRVQIVLYLCIGTAFLSAIAGLLLASRQVWLQSLPPDQVPSCGPDIYFALENFPLSNVLKSMILGTGNCAEVQWVLLGLSIPAWNIINFSILIFGIIATTILVRMQRDIKQA